VLNTWTAPATGTLDLATGTSTTNVPLQSLTILTGNVLQPCPRCSATGSPGNPGTGTCDRGPRTGLTCVTTNSQGLTRDCPTGGADATHPCTPGNACIDGTFVGTLSVDLSPLTTGTASKTEPNGAFCPGQDAADYEGCFNSQDCRTITENGKPAGPITNGVPANATLASVFCIPASGNLLIDGTAALPGPGATSLPGQFVVTVAETTTTSLAPSTTTTTTAPPTTTTTTAPPTTTTTTEPTTTTTEPTTTTTTSTTPTTIGPTTSTIDTTTTTSTTMPGPTTLDFALRPAGGV
jgi:hypothetical protein